MEEIDSLRDRAREDKYARLNMQERNDGNSNADGKEESNVLLLSYTQYNKIQQKRIDSYSVDCQFRSTVPNNMLPKIPKPIKIE